MSNKLTLKPVVAALGTTFAVSLAAIPVVNADENPFQMTELSNGGYMVAGADTEGSCGEGKCGEGKCGETAPEGGDDKGGEGKCGEGKCGEGKCGEAS